MQTTRFREEFHGVWVEDEESRKYIFLLIKDIQKFLSRE
jgi:hypothetical protein